MFGETLAAGLCVDAEAVGLFICRFVIQKMFLADQRRFVDCFQWDLFCMNLSEFELLFLVSAE